MANVTQTIHSLTQGISQQPDEQKIPGQVNDMENALPNITQGLLKRPAGEFVGSLTGATTTGRWFHYYRDEAEQYIGQVAQDGTVRMWDCLTGNSKTVVDVTTGSGAAKYLYHSGEEDIQTLTLNDFTYLNNRTKTVEMDTTTEPDTNFKKEMYVELKSISYSKQYALNLFSDQTTKTVTTATRIKVDRILSSNNYCSNVDQDTGTGVKDGFMHDHAGRINNHLVDTSLSSPNITIRCTEHAGDGRDAFAPNVGTKIFSVTDGGAQDDTGAVGGIKLLNGTKTDTAFTYNIDVKNGSTDVSGLSGASARTPKNLYFRIATTGQSVPYTTGTGSNQETTYQARYTTTHDLLHGGEGWMTGDYFYVWMKDAYYKVTVESHSTSQVQANLALARPQPTPFDTETTITAESILGDIKSAIIADGNISANNIEIIGSGLYIKHTVKFNGSTPVGELLNVVAGQVSDVGDLPTQCKHGMVVEVINSAAEEDNYYVKFYGKLKENGDPDNDADYLDGEGIWEECAQPGRKIRLKRSTMPVVLIRTEDGNFRLTELDGSTYGISSLQTSGFTFSSTTANNTVTINKTNHGFNTDDFLNIESNDLTNGQFTVTRIDANNFSYESASNEGAHTNVACTVGNGFRVPKWDDALVGDSVTNPEPSFVNKQINKLLFFRNRFAILADEFIVLSRAGDFTNFFAKSAIQLIASDPIDISSSSDTPAILYDGIEVNTGLILFTRTQQFMLTTDSDAFTPLTAKINALSSYNFNYTTNPISMGTTIAFLDNAGKYSRFWEMTRIQREGEPQVIEQSAVVNKLFNKDLKYISNSKENSIIFFSEKGTNVLYGFRYFDQVFERKLASWFKWTFTGSIQYHCMQDDALYVVNMVNGNQHLQKFSIKRETETPFIYYFKSDSSTQLTFNRETEYLLHLDNLTKVSSKSSVPTGYTGITATYDTSNDKTTLSGLPSSFTTGYNFAAYDPDVSLQMGKYAPNLVKYINIKGSDTYAQSGETIFFSENHGLSQNDLVIYEPIGEQTLIWNYNNTVISNGTILRVITNGSFSATSQFKLSPLINSTSDVGAGFSNVGNDQQVLKVEKLGGVGGVLPYVTTNNKFYLDGNWTNQDFLIGYDFTMKIKLPTFYYSTKDGENFRSDSSANTIIHRIKMGFGPVGRYKAIVNSNFPTSDNESGLLYEEEFEHLAVFHQATQIEDDVQQRVIPFYQKNKNATLTIESTHPTPATIHNLTWEGVYTPPYYTRV